MADCWDSSEIDDAVKRCAVKAGFGGKVWPAESDVADRDKLCSTKECVEFYREFQYQRDQGCGIVNAFSATPSKDGLRDGRHDSRFCDYLFAAPTGTPATTVPATPKPTIVPATSKPTPVPATPVPTTAPVTVKPTTTTTTPAPTAPLTLVSITTPPPTASATALVASTGLSAGAAAAIGGCAVVAVVALICLIVLCCRRRRDRRNESKGNYPSPQGEGASTEFSQFSSPRATFDAARASTASSSLWAHSSITTNRIPLDNLQVGPCISHGGYGEVCIGTYKNAPVAIKRLLPIRRKDPESIASFLSEIQLTSTLDHACIVTFIGVAWDAPSDLCMVSEFISGGDMRSYLGGRASNSQGFDDDKLHIAVCVAHALTYLHSLQPVVVHRDLKSRNILLTQKPELHAKLMDFGVSCDRRDTTMTAGVGTSLWMAPEVMLGERYNEKADVFSFGVVLSELDTHELPYAQAKDPNSDRRMSEMVLMQRVVSGSLKPSFSSKADPEIVALADECLQLDPNMRPSAAVVLYRLHKNRFSA